MKILLVDDDVIFCDYLAVCLKRIGHTSVTVTHSGAETLTKLDEIGSPFDCILLDINMPKMNGIQLCKIIRERAEYRTTPIIMISSEEESSGMKRAFGAGAIDYLKKPVDPMELSARVRAADFFVKNILSEKTQRRRLEMSLGSADGGLTSPEMRVTFSRIPNMRDYFQLENRLFRLGEGSFKMNLFTVELNGIQKLFNSLSGQEALAIVSSTSAILGEVLPDRGALFSYLGNGKFLCLIVAGSQMVLERFAARVEEHHRHFIHSSELKGIDKVTIECGSLSSRSLLTSGSGISLSRRYVGKVGHETSAGMPSIWVNA